MADTPRFGIRFQARDERASSDIATTTVGDKPGVPIYRRAVELAARAHQVIECADAERFFLRDQLDRKSSMIPQLIAEGLAVADMAARMAEQLHHDLLPADRARLGRSKIVVQSVSARRAWRNSCRRALTDC